MLERLRRKGLDVVVASRYLAPGGTGNLTPGRVWLSGWGAWLSRLVTKQNLSDPMSGFFALRRGFFEEVTYDVTAIGFKIMLDIVASAKRPVRIGEVPYTFGARKSGESKLDVNASDFATLDDSRGVGTRPQIRLRRPGVQLESKPFGSTFWRPFGVQIVPPQVFCFH